MKTGQKITLFGQTYTITIVEPQSDWYWAVEAISDEEIAGEYETLYLKVPAESRID